MNAFEIDFDEAIAKCLHHSPRAHQISGLKMSENFSEVAFAERQNLISDRFEL